MKNVINRKNCCWAVIIVVMVFIHCFRIGQVPCGINVDEMGMGYDAWCLSNYGTDRYLNTFPVYLINFSGGQSALYAYLCAPFVHFFGISAAVLRIPAIIFSFITLFFSVRVADRIWKNEKINLLVGMLYTVSPVFLMLSRIGLDCNLMLGMSAIFIYLLIRAVDRGKYQDYFVAGIAGGLLLYSYVLSHMAMPLFILLMMLYLLYVKQINMRQILFLGVPLFILAFPLLLFHYINITGMEELQLGIFTIPRMYRYRSGDLSLDLVGKNLGRFFRMTLFYDNVPFSSIPEYGNMYFLAIPFIITGIVHGGYRCVCACKSRSMDNFVVIMLWALSIYLTGIFIADDGPTVYRVNSIFFAYLLFEADGILVLYHIIKKLLRIRAEIFWGIVTAVYAVIFLSFIVFYFKDYIGSRQTVDLFNYPFVDALDYMEKELPENVADRTTYIGEGDQIYIYYLGGTLLPPDAYNVLADDKPYTLWLWTQSYKNYRFYFPEKIDPAGNYIVPDTADSWIALYEQYGFKKEHIGRNYVFWNDLLDETQPQVQALVDWGHGIVDGKIAKDDGDSTYLSGWSLNTSYNTTWDDIVAVIDGQNYYTAEKMEREDVSDALGNDALKQCGFHITVPNEALQDSETVRIVFLDYTHRKCYVETY